ncbi:HD domain-containing protein [Methylosinus sporium]|uniref:HD domain-containing protein n=1 Tax=Methylosinus sporium TaxID=428 RepID=A0A549T7L6_METSR|nr:HD domain-containing phosphohydrolase [Methylosinus sporium]TRL37855.1 HD domain-containing protein [Methylosinus sporium]
MRSPESNLQSIPTDAFSNLSRRIAESEQSTPGLGLAFHSHRVSALVAHLASVIGHEASAARFSRAAYFHDLGKLAVPTGILMSPDVLTSDERAIVETHSESGADILASSSAPDGALAADIARWHHTRFDGSGYPKGRVGSEIPLAARITAVADVYDALRSRRSYKPEETNDSALARMRTIQRAGSGFVFDPQILEALFDTNRNVSLLWDAAALCAISGSDTNSPRGRPHRRLRP